MICLNSLHPSTVSIQMKNRLKTSEGHNKVQFVCSPAINVNLTPAVLKLLELGCHHLQCNIMLYYKMQASIKQSTYITNLAYQVTLYSCKLSFYPPVVTP